MQKALVVLCTVPDRFTARKIERALVAERPAAERPAAGRLAACVNRIGPVRSTYRWKGKVGSDREYLLLIKTTRRRYGALERRIRALHPYEVPEVIAIPVERGSARYLAWLKACTR